MQLRQKNVDLLNLTPDTDVEVIVNQIIRAEVCFVFTALHPALLCRALMLLQ